MNFYCTLTVQIWATFQWFSITFNWSEKNIKNSISCGAWGLRKIPVIYLRMIHYNDVIIGAIASQITSLTIVYSTVYSDADERKHQSSASLAFVWGIHGWRVNTPHKLPITRKMFRFDDVIMQYDVFISGWEFLSLFRHSMISIS